MPFGNGTHACPGNELAKLEMLVLLHHLTTKYRLVNFSITNDSTLFEFKHPFADSILCNQVEMLTCYYYPN